MIDITKTGIKDLIDAKLNKGKQPVTIAVDGRCASGKTTLAGLLSEIYSSSVVHMDDFFLPPELRTSARYNQAGGNVHYERFSKEVAPYIKSGNSFSYRVFNCKNMDYDGEVCVSSSDLIIVEGVYSLRPEFRELYDIKVFMDIAPEEQKRRLILRGGEEGRRMFEERWIPLEERYLKEFNVKDCCDIILC